MSKIDWKKPLRTVDWATAKRVTGRDLEVYTFKSDSQRVVWVDDRVYPVDEQGLCTADVEYPGFRKCEVGDPMVENVPEEPKDHLCIWLNDPLSGKASIDSLGGSQLQTKATWEKHFGPRIGRYVILVKVPV